jgi:subtilisin family serine protease
MAGRAALPRSRAGLGPRAACRALGVVAALCAVTSGARAAIDLGAVARSGMALPRVVGAQPSTIVEVPPGAEPPARFVRIGTTPSGSTLGVLDLGVESLASLALARPELTLSWSPPLRLLLDRADAFTGASAFRNATGLTGRGVVLGIVDTGVDPTHPDLRDEHGKSRILWWLDFSRERAGRHPELEDELGCRVDPKDINGVPCAVLDGDDVDALLADGDASNDPGDYGGHGTHVASLAGGTGRSNEPARYVGVAPEASYIVARVTRKGGGIYDSDVLKAASFVFERAEELARPAVVNLSLGSDFGGHDGTSPVERGLESLVGAEHPGRAIVVAAGNSATLYAGLDTGTPEPLGVHTEVHVPEHGQTLVPIVTPATAPGVTEGTIYVWITVRPGDALKVGVEHRAGTILRPVAPGDGALGAVGNVEVTVLNGVTNETSPIPPGSYGAAVVIDGSWSSSDVFGLELEGPASARLWIEGDGGLSPELSIGPLLPRAQKEGTINVPASSPELIAVGATVNRTEWPDFAGETVALDALGPPEAAPPDTLAYFSSAGPNALGALKPDLVAPGAYVVGAMAAGADPRQGGAGGLFDDGGLCNVLGYVRGCFVVDDAHAVTGGTSMSAPLVTGAIALLFERDPTLHQGELKALLQAGARRLHASDTQAQQLGAGALDLGRTLQALDEGMLERVPGGGTELLLAGSYAHPDPSWPLAGLVELRDDQDEIADGFEPARLALFADGASVSEPLTRLAPGLWSFAITAPAGSGGRSLALSLRFDGREVAAKRMPIAVERSLANTLPSARGGCAMAGRQTRAGGSGLAALGGLATLWFGRRRTARRVRRQSSTK